MTGRFERLSGNYESWSRPWVHYGCPAYSHENRAMAVDDVATEWWMETPMRPVACPFCGEPLPPADRGEA